MSQILILSDDEYNVLLNILTRAKSNIASSTPEPAPKKKSKTEIGLDRIREYRANKNKKK